MADDKTVISADDIKKIYSNLRMFQSTLFGLLEKKTRQFLKRENYLISVMMVQCNAVSTFLLHSCDVRKIPKIGLG